MKKLKFFFIILLFAFCSKGTNSESGGFCTIKGIVYVDDQPTPNVRVEYGYARVRGSDVGTQLVWSSSTIATDENGQYLFKIKEMRGSYNYRVRAENPITRSWTQYYRGTVMAGYTKTHDFRFYSSKD